MASGVFNLKQQLFALAQQAWGGPQRPKYVEYLVVAGGGGGGKLRGGGGGAGGLLTGIVPVATDTSYTVTIGGGGVGATTSGNGITGSNGVASVFGRISATGGGGGASAGGVLGGNGASGGSGGGSTIDTDTGALTGTAGQGTVGQGNAGCVSILTNMPAGGGGGGAGIIAPGYSANTGGNGGAGIASTITGTVTTYAGGGGGGIQSNGAAVSTGVGGVGGGGNAGFGAQAGFNGIDNTGGGGGGDGNGGASPYGGTGGSGIVIVRYPGSVQFYTGGTVWASHDGYVVHSFVASGSLAPTTPTQLNPYPVAFGAAYGGGYFAGRYNLSGTTYNLIVAPKATGYNASAAYKDANTGDTGANSYSDGLTNSNAINNASHPAAQFCRGLTIGGYTDWYLPSVDELNTVYNYLKPGTTLNSATPGLGGYNTGAVAPELYNTAHSPGRPRQTSLFTWQVGGVESFEELIYVTSTSDNGAGTARVQYFDNAIQWYDNKTNTANKVRAIRKVAI